jgi:hypothetical protein
MNGEYDTKHYNIHHIDHNRQNASYFNLELLSTADHALNHRGKKLYAINLGNDERTLFNSTVQAAVSLGIRKQNIGRILRGGSGRVKSRSKVDSQWSSGILLSGFNLILTHFLSRFSGYST